MSKKDYHDYPYAIRKLRKILSIDMREFNDELIKDYCSNGSKQVKSVDFKDKNLPIGICLHARNVSDSVKEKYLIGSYNGQYDDLIDEFEEEDGDDDL